MIIYLFMGSSFAFVMSYNKCVGLHLYLKWPLIGAVSVYISAFTSIPSYIYTFVWINYPRGRAPGFVTVHRYRRPDTASRLWFPWVVDELHRLNQCYNVGWYHVYWPKHVQWLQRSVQYHDPRKCHVNQSLCVRRLHRFDSRLRQTVAKQSD